MKAVYEAFRQRKLVEVSPHNNATPEDFDCFWWIERGEDYYALMSPQLKYKKVLLVTREAWLNGEPVAAL